jgi:uncharacterized surface protein with fasciclin (FAS1) repeats
MARRTTGRQDGASALGPSTAAARIPSTRPHTKELFVKRMLAVLVLAAVAAVPFAAVSSAQSQNIVQVAASDPQFSTVVGLIQKAGLAETLSSGRYTVFAPTNAAFAKVPKSTLDALAADPDALRAVLTYHVAKGRLTAGTVVRRTRIKTVNGASVRVSVRGSRVFLNRTTRVTKTNIRASNGVIHVIDRVLLPPSR